MQELYIELKKGDPQDPQPKGFVMSSLSPCARPDDSLK